MDKVYKIQITLKAEKQLGRLPGADREMVRGRIRDLADNPRPRGVEKIETRKDRYRLRVGNYRVIYNADDAALIVLILRIGDRKEVYRRIA